MSIIKENSSFRIGWDVLILGLILISCVLIPYQVAFNHFAYKSGSELLYIIDFFFLIDIILNFKTSYRHQGSEIMDKKRISMRYLKSMFVVDLLANLPFDALFLAHQDILVFNVSLVLIFRLFRLLRIVRLFVIFRRWEEQSWTNAGYLRIVKFFSIVALLIHWIACAWFFSAYVERFPADSWVVAAGISAADTGTQYVRSLYWAITTMTTVGYGDITPSRNIEYIITMIVMMLGASMYAFIIGNIASLVSKLDAAKASFWSRIESINQFLRSRQVPASLNKQVREYYEYIWAQHRGVKEELLFDDLPDPLRLEILRHLTKDLIKTVPLFRHASPTLQNVLLMSLRPQTYAPDGFIVHEGEIGREIYFISRGKVEIISESTQRTYATLEDGEYFGDLSLLLHENRTASVRALTFCEVFVLHESDFMRIKKDYEEFREVLKNMSSEKTEKIVALVIEGVVL
jgi:ion transport protein/cyclic nucleotide-binding protein